MMIRVWYLDENDERRSYDWEISDGNLRSQLDKLGKTVASRSLVIVDDDGGFRLAFPASRLLLLERLPWS